MASAATKTGNGALPTGFKSPFVRVEQEGSHDDLLAVAATLTNKTLADVKKMAVTLGMRANGPFYFDEVLFRKVLFNLSPLACSPYQDFVSGAALPDVCVLCLDYDENEAARHVLFHRVRALTPDGQSFSYVIDPAGWIDAKHQVTTDLRHLNMQPAWFLEITQRANPNGKSPSGKGK
jgi:hypothetical protein